MSFDFGAWRKRMGYNRSQAADKLGLGRNQPKRYEDEGVEVPKYMELACRQLEDNDMTKDRKKEIVAITMLNGDTRPFPEIHKFYVDWFDSNGLRELPAKIEREIFDGLRSAIVVENRNMERSALGHAETWSFFDRMELLAIFTTDRAKALVDCWASPINLREHFGYNKVKGE